MLVSGRPIRKILPAALSLLFIAFALTALAAIVATERPAAQPAKSMIVRQDEAKVTRGDWGHMLHYFAGESKATKDVLVAVATVEPGKAVHKAHRHAMEEYLMLLEGSGVWSLDGKSIPAKAGDVLYVEPWVYHGLTNTGDKPLRFAVVRYTSKGVEPPARPDDRPDEM
jgi:mannose-6-phosphate isomerase-like protein (cupin superfamily)